MTDWNFSPQPWTGAEPIFEKPHVARFETGEVIEYFAGQVIITRADDLAKLTLPRRLDESYTPEYPRADVFWWAIEKWSDGQEIPFEEVRVLMGKAQFVSERMGLKDDQTFRKD